MRPILLSLVALSCVSTLHAHPVPQTNRDRTIVVRVTPRALIVDYRLELDEGSIPNELTTTERARITSRPELLQAFTNSFAEAASRNLDASLDGQELTFQCVQQKYQASDHVRCDYRFEAPWTLSPGVEHHLKFHECNYVTDEFSRLGVYMAADEGIHFLSTKAPTTELMSRKSDERKPGDDNLLRRVSATFRLETLLPTAEAKPAFPPDDLNYKSEPEEAVTLTKPAAQPLETLAKTSPDDTIAAAKRSPASPVTEATVLPAPSERPDATGESSVGEPVSLWARIVHPNVLMNLLLDTKAGLAVLLFIAALAGAAHALTPGHGKTMVAAYLVGQRGTYWHAIILGIVTTITHTAAVIALAVLVLLLPGSEKQVLALQGLIGGFLITGLGLWLLMRRLAGQADHFHVGGTHHHHHHDDDAHYHVHPHEHDVAKKTTLWEVITLGMGGGILPCWDAVILLGFAISSGRTQLGLPLLLAFSAGLAAVLVLLGLIVVGASRVARLAAPSSNGLKRLAQALPIVSALIVTGMGLWLCYGALNP